MCQLEHGKRGEKKLKEANEERVDIFAECVVCLFEGEANYPGSLSSSPTKHSNVAGNANLPASPSSEGGRQAID